MNNLLVGVAEHIKHIIDTTKYRSQLPERWTLLSKQYTKLENDEIFWHLFLYYCERFLVSGISRSGAFDEMMVYAYANEYVKDRDDIIFRDVMCLYMICRYEGSKLDCLGQDWPKSNLVNYVFHYQDDAGEDQVTEFYSGRYLGSSFNQ